jgi:hypothetical protein
MSLFCHSFLLFTAQAPLYISASQILAASSNMGATVHALKATGLMLEVVEFSAYKQVLCTEVMGRLECQQEEDWALLLMRMHNYSTGSGVNLLVEKTGADAMCLKFPEDPGLLQLIDVHSIEGMPSFNFTCTTLKVRHVPESLRLVPECLSKCS